MPIDIATGAIQHYAADISITGKVSLDWDRYYDSRLANTDSPLGFGWTCRYFCTLTKEKQNYLFVDGEGSIVTFTDINDQLQRGQKLVHFGAFSELYISEHQYIVTQWDIDSGEVWQYHFPFNQEKIHALQAITEPSGQGIELAYNKKQQLIGIRQKLEKRTLLLRYNQQNKISSIDFLFPNKKTQTLTQYNYDSQGNLVEIIDASNHRDLLTYDKYHRVIEKKGKDHSINQFYYDELGRCIHSTGIGGYDEKHLCFIDNANWVEVTDSEEAIWRYQYNANGQIIREVNPLGAEKLTKYDHENRIVKIIDAIGAVTCYEYDQNGNRCAVIDGLGQKSEVTYNNIHLPIVLVDVSSNKWQRSYDNYYRLILLEDPENNQYQLQYDDKGNLKEITDPLGNTLYQKFNSRGILQATTDWLGHITYYQSDSFGRLTQITDPLGHITQYHYDILGQLTHINYPDGTQNIYHYDTGGNLIHFTDRNTQSTKYQYGHCGRLIERQDALGRVLHFGWSNEPDQLETITNAKKEVYHLIYDSAGQIRTEIGFDGRELNFEYDLAGRRTTFINGLGESINYQYDLLGRLIKQSSKDIQTSFSYTATGFLKQANNNDSQITFKRNKLGQITEEIQNEHIIKRTYTATGDLTQLNTNHNLKINYHFDANGLLQNLVVQGHDPIQISRDARGIEILRNLPGQNQLHQQIDAMGRLQQQSVVVGHHLSQQAFQNSRAIISRSYNYDKAQLVGIKDSFRGETNYVYDPVERLTDALRNKGISEHFLYDDNDNIHTIDQDNQSSTLQYAQGNRLQRKQTDKQHSEYIYDSHGRLIEKHEKSGEKEAQLSSLSWYYEWDSLDQLRTITKPNGERWKYAYDAFGRRISKQSSSGEQTSFVWDEDVVLHEIQHQQKSINHWIFDPHSFAPLAKIEQNQFYSIINDHLGTPQELINIYGDIVWQAYYNAWGDIHEQYHNKVDCPIRFQGQWADDESNLYYNRFRYYDPNNGHYISQDIIGILGQYNIYSYSINPILWIDPLGLCPTSERAKQKSIRKQRHHSKSAEYTKHTKATSKEDAIKRSKDNAQYWDESNGTGNTAFRNTIEKEGLRNGLRVPQEGGSDYYIYDAGRTIGYNEGKATSYMRIEVTKSGTPEFHGHPISKARYEGYKKNAED
ncbi:MAG: RHS repeat-associated core domain-containing protein [bacterium]